MAKRFLVTTIAILTALAGRAFGQYPHVSAEIQHAADEQKRVRVVLIGSQQLRTIGPLSQTNTKHGRACILVERFPELNAFLPPFRKPWMSEDARMSIFDSLAFAVASFPSQLSSAQPSGQTTS